MESKRMFFYGLCAAMIVVMVIISSFDRLRMYLKPMPRRSGELTMILEVQDILRDGSLDARVKFPGLDTVNLQSVDLSRVGAMDCTTTQYLSNSSRRSSPLTAFSPTVTAQERLVMLLTLQVFIRSMEKHKLTYFLLGGSLLGSYRHHGLIHWDDDIDVIIKADEKEQVCKVLSNVSGYITQCPKDYQWKFFREDLRPIKGHKHAWPFVDIFFLKENSTHAWEELEVAKRSFYLKDEIFPLGRRPFEGAMLPAPRSVSSMLKTFNDPHTCTSPTYCHKSESFIQRKRVETPCSVLRELYPFVNRSRSREGFIREDLVFADQVLNTIELPDSSSERWSQQNERNRYDE